MMYRIEFSRRADRSFDRLPREIRTRLTRAIDALANDPLPSGATKLSGQNNLYRIRVGDYRVIYAIENEILLVLVLSIGHRREIYRDL